MNIKLVSLFRTAAAGLALIAGLAVTSSAGAGEPIQLRAYVVTFAPVVFGGDGGPLNELAAAGAPRAVLPGTMEGMIEALHRGNISVRVSSAFDVPVPVAALTAGVSGSGSFDLERGAEQYHGSIEQIDGGKKLHFHAVYKDAPVDRAVDGDMLADQPGVLAVIMKDVKYQAPHADVTLLLLARPAAGAGR